MPNKHSHVARCTASQKEAVAEAAKNAGKTPAAFIRLALDGCCAAFGVVYPQNLQPRGKYDRSKIDWKKLAGLTDPHATDSDE